eukprot:COSAG05_NODE_851_length_6973_cov_6.213995_2_plen_293_part_00
MVIHLQGGVPFNSLLQLPMLHVPYILVSFLPGQIGFLAWIAVLVISLVFLAKAYRRLWALRVDLEDVAVNLAAGMTAIALMVAFMLMRSAGRSFANPDGGIQVLFPSLFAVLGTAHIAITQSKLLWQLHKSSAKDGDKFARGSDSDTDDDSRIDEGRATKWLKMIRKSSKDLVLAKIGPATISPTQEVVTEVVATTAAVADPGHDSSSSEYASTSSEESEESSSEESANAAADSPEQGFALSEQPPPRVQGAVVVAVCHPKDDLAEGAVGIGVRVVEPTVVLEGESVCQHYR